MFQYCGLSFFDKKTMIKFLFFKKGKMGKMIDAPK